MAVINRCTLLGSEHPVIGGRRRGQGMVEFALILPLILLLISGIIEFGRMLSIYNSVSNAAREAARYGSVVGSNGTTYYFLDCTGMRDSAKRASAFAVLTDPDIAIVYDHGSGSSFGTCAQGTQPSPSIANADRVVVTVTATYAPILPLLPISSRTFTFTAARSIFPNIATGPQCYDGLDNDGDGFTDYPADTTCPSSAGTSEGTIACYTLTVTATNGTVATTSQNCSGGYTLNTVVTLSATPNTGYTFGSWSGDLSGSTNPTSITMSANKSVTANFNATCYTLTTSVAPVGSGSVSASPTNSAGCAAGQYTYNESISLTASANPAFSFTNWTGDLTGSANPGTLTMPAANAAVTANFTAVPCYTLTLTAGAGGTASASPGVNCITQYNSGTSVTLSATADPGYVFNNWTGSSTSSSNPLVVTMDSAKNYTANFTATPCFSLTTAVNGINPSGGSLGATGGTVSASPAPTCSGNYYSGTVITLTASPSLVTGFTFTSWTGGVTGSANPTSFTITGNTSVTANFTATCYALTTAVSPAGPPAVSTSLLSSPNGTCAAASNYTYNAQVRLTANAAGGYTFTNWSGTVTGSSNPVTLTMPAAPATATANYTTACVSFVAGTFTSPASNQLQLDYTNYTGVTRNITSVRITFPTPPSSRRLNTFVYVQDLSPLIFDSSSPGATSGTTVTSATSGWNAGANTGILNGITKTLLLQYSFTLAGTGSFTVTVQFNDGCAAITQTSSF